VVDIKRVGSVEPDRRGKLDYLVTYQIDAYRIYMVTIPKDKITDEIIKDAVRKDLEAIEEFKPLDYEFVP